ncbi:MAG: hypothetical protein Q4E69_03235 [Bacilli bacterium]|nr:hypothetical protein [Bacilli bacterium]
MNQDGFNNIDNTNDNGISVGNSGVKPNQPPVGSNDYGKEQIIQCPKCGEKMKISARCCMHCGELNYLNHKNDSVKPSFNLGKKLRQREDKIAAKKAAKLAKKAKYINGVDVTSQERAKKYVFFKRITDFLTIVLLIVAVINYKTIYRTFEEFRAKYYLKQVDIMIEQISEELNEYECNSTEEDGRLVYSFYSSDDYFKTGVSLYTFNYFTGYIDITKTPDGYKYVLNITDGKYGFKNLPYEDMEIKSIKKVSEIYPPSNTVSCS